MTTDVLHRHDSTWTTAEPRLAARVDTAVLLIGRLLFGGYFVYAGVHHFMDYPMLSSFAASKGVPAPDVAVFGTGLLLLAGGIGVLSGLYRFGAVCLAIFLVGVTPAIHNFWDVGPDQRMTELGNFLKNVALLGATAFVAVTVKHPSAALRQPMPRSLDRSSL